MRIVFDVSSIQRRAAGIGQAGRNLLSALLAYDVENEYVLHGWSWSLDTPCVRSLHRENVSVNAHRIPGFVRRWYWDRLRNPAIEHLLGDFDIFHSCDPFSPRTRNAVLVTLHDLLSIEHPEWFAAGVVSRHEALMRSLERAGAILVPSQWTRDKLVALRPTFASKAEIVNWFPDPSFVPHDPDRKDDAVLLRLGIRSPYLLCVGTLEPRKNLVNLLKAFRIIRSRSVGDLALVIAGKRGWNLESLRKEIGDRSSSDHISFLGYVAQVDLPALYRKAHAFVYPSWDEGFGLPILEALASGCVVVASDIPPFHELYSDAVVFVDPHAPESIAEGIRSALENEDLRSRHISLGLLTAKRYESRTTAQKIVRVYRNLSAAPRRPG